jgi:uncharacterized lipoprotein YajG
MKSILFILSALCLFSGIQADEQAPATSEEVAVSTEASEETVEVSQETEGETAAADQDNTLSCRCHKKGH